MSSVVFGNNMVLEVKIDDLYVPIGCAFSCSFEFENEIIGKTDVNAGLFRKKRVRISDTRASVQGLTTLLNNSTISVMYLLQQNRVEHDLRFRFIDEDNYAWQIQGFFIVKSIPITGNVSEFSEFDIQFEGTGGFSQSIPGDSSGEAGASIPGDVIFDWWELAEGGTSITGAVAGHFGRSFLGHEVIEVDREGTELEQVTGVPGNREYAYDLTTISIDPTNPGNPAAPSLERIYVIWQIASDAS